MAINGTKIVNGYVFDKRIPLKVCKVLSDYVNTSQRIRIFVGNPVTGKDECHEEAVLGYVTADRFGDKRVWFRPASSISDIDYRLSADDHARIIRITVDKVDVYRHPKYHIGKITFGLSGRFSTPYAVFIDGKDHGHFKTQEKAKKWADFIQGKSNKV